MRRRPHAAILAASVAFNVAAGAHLTMGNLQGKPGAIEKVVGMLEDLKQKVSLDGDQEAKTYEQFACFCKTTSEDKLAAIEQGSNLKDTLQATINDATVKRDEADSNIQAKLEAMRNGEEELKALKAERHAARTDYAKSELDLTQALQALSAAIKRLKATKAATTSLVQLRPVAKTITRALQLAEGLGLLRAWKSNLHRAAAALLDEEELPAAAYEFQGDDIINMLEDLQKDFRKRKETLDADEVAAQEAFDKQVEAMKNVENDGIASIEESKKEKAEATATIATASQDLTATSAQLLDDQEYIKELSAKCNAKALLWDQRSRSRADEITALTSAIGVLKELLEPAAALMDLGGNTKAWSTQMVARPDRVAADFLQVDSRSPRHRLSALLRHRAGAARGQDARTSRTEILNLLRARGTVLQSSVLLRMADQLAKDPLAKVKKMIQELIERLLQEAAEEASHKGWCDKETGLAVQARDTAADEVETVNNRLATEEARRDKLYELVKGLTREVNELEEGLAKQQKLRDAESAENAESLAEAERGKAGLEQAMQILHEHYQKVKAESQASLLQESQSQEPDAGFDSAYTGSMNGGVMGMLEMVRDDFEREAKDIKKAEDDAAKDFSELKKTTEVSLATKEVALKERSANLEELEQELTTESEALSKHQDKLNAALEELRSLHGACVDKPMTAEEKAQKRKEEIEALKQALCILDQGSLEKEEFCI